jgi:hypothetical protein
MPHAPYVVRIKRDIENKVDRNLHSIPKLERDIGIYSLLYKFHQPNLLVLFTFTVININYCLEFN